MKKDATLLLVLMASPEPVGGKLLMLVMAGLLVFSIGIAWK